MSPLAAFLLRLMRAGSVSAAIFVVLVIGIEIWKHWRFGGLSSMGRPDWGFMGILVLMLLGFLWLARAIGRELGKPRT